MAMTHLYNVGDQVTPLSKTMTQEAINLFEKSGGKTGRVSSPMSRRRAIRWARKVRWRRDACR